MTPEVTTMGQATLKIAGHTSTTLMGTTMIIELQVRSADDVFVDNEVLCLHRNERLVGLPLAATAWLVPGEPPSAAHRIAIAHVAGLILKRLGGYVVWLLACNSTVQPDSRVVRHRKLWGALKAQGLALPFGRELPERVIEAPEGLRYFAAIQLGLGSYDSAVTVLHAEPASHLIALREEHRHVAELLTVAGWNRPSFGPSADILSAVCEVGGVVLWPVGAFDDRDGGAAALAKKEVVAKLL
jgi:hypothetical protein